MRQKQKAGKGAFPLKVLSLSLPLAGWFMLWWPPPTCTVWKFVNEFMSARLVSEGRDVERSCQKRAVLRDEDKWFQVCQSLEPR